MAKHERVYNDLKEKKKRFNIFKENVERIENFNANASSSKSFKLGVNAFTDLTNEEFLATHTGYKKFHHSGNSKANGTNGVKYQGLSSEELPNSLDWKERGAVTGVKDQGECGCCWAFSTVTTVEGLNYIKTGQLMSLSEQELLDCVTSNQGCKEGSIERSFEYIQQSQIGLVKEDMYPYQSTQGQCQLTSNIVSAVKINGYQRLPMNDEDALMQAVAHQPVSVGIDSSGMEFHNYQSGIFNGNCGQHLTHVVVIFGYGTDQSGQDYWLVKNSW